MKIQSENTFSFYQLKETHFKDVQYLMKKVFNKSVSINHLKNKYADYINVGFISTIAYDEQKPIGFYGAISQEFIHHGKKIIAAHACDSYTLKEYQGRGVHYNLAKLSYDIMKTKQIQFIYAFHSENTYHSTKKLGWTEREEMARFHIPTGAFPLAKVYKKLNLQKQFLHKVDKMLKPYVKSGFEYKSTHSHQAFTSGFLEYKNSIYPHHLIEIDGCVFYLKVDAIMQVGFFTFDTPKNLGVALHKLKEIARELGINELLFQVSENSEMYNGLKKFIVPKPSWKIGYLTFEEINLTPFEFTFVNLDTF